MATSGQLMTMPILIVNMGGEMVYILEQRLQAQKIPEQKGQKVLNDVVRTMYYPRFIEELFKPQEMYSIQSTRQIFDKLAHSSIMRLNESSMDKLFDLMSMGFKYQIISCKAPRELIDVTMNHLDALKKVVNGTPQLTDLLEECTRQMHMAFDNMPDTELNAMRQSLCSFFQDRKVKVSLFLQDQTQNVDGSIVVPSAGSLRPGQFVPGTVRYFQGGNEVRRDQLAPISSGSFGAAADDCRTSLGANLYEKDRNTGAPAAAPAPEAAPVAEQAAASPMEAPAPAAHAGSAAAVGELNLLASLIGVNQGSNADTFKLEHLFSSNVFGKDGPAKASGPEVIEIDGTAPSDHHRGLDRIRQQMDIGNVDPHSQQDDLLDLMDNA